MYLLFQENSTSRASEETPLVVVSSSDSVLHAALKQQECCRVCVASGAGYKCLCVVEGLVDAYIYSGDACFAWDTCAAHALLLSMGGGMTPLKAFFQGLV